MSYQFYRAIFEYDGTDFFGWQLLPDKVTVSSVIISTFERKFGKSLKLYGASRTDAGVHARGQLTVLKTELSISPQKLCSVINSSLPNAILMKDCCSFDRKRHLFPKITGKLYSYKIFTKAPSPFYARFGYYPSFADSIDWQKFEEALNLFIGEHDFSAFCKSESDQKDVPAISRIKKIWLERSGRENSVTIFISGDGFYRHQIRRMLGAALDVARSSSFSLEKLKKTFVSRNSNNNFSKLPACGLTLEKVLVK